MFNAGYSALKEDYKSHSSHPSLSGLNMGAAAGVPDSQPSISSLDQNLSPGVPRDGEDLYTWMAKHQDFVDTGDKMEPGVINKGAFWVSLSFYVFLWG